MTTDKTTEAVATRAAALRKLPRLTLQDMAREAGLSGWAGAKRDALALSIAQHEAGVVPPPAPSTPPPADDGRLLGPLLRLVRERHKVSRQVLAERMGQTPQAISELENHRPQERSLSAAAKALGLTLEGLLLEGLAALRGERDGVELILAEGQHAGTHYRDAHADEVVRVDNGVLVTMRAKKDLRVGKA